MSKTLQWQIAGIAGLVAGVAGIGMTVGMTVAGARMRDALHVQIRDLESKHGELESKHGDLESKHGDLKRQHGELKRQHEREQGDVEGLDDEKMLDYMYSYANDVMDEMRRFVANKNNKNSHLANVELMTRVNDVLKQILGVHWATPHVDRPRKYVTAFHSQGMQVFIRIIGSHLHELKPMIKTHKGMNEDLNDLIFHFSHVFNNMSIFKTNAAIPQRLHDQKRALDDFVEFVKHCMINVTRSDLSANEVLNQLDPSDASFEEMKDAIDNDIKMFEEMITMTSQLQ